MSSTDTTDRDNRSSAEIEREVEETRAGLTNTLEELRDRAAPGQLFEQALDYARTSGGADMMRNLGQSVRDNPLPLVLIGAGIGWLMFTGNQRSQPHSRVEAGYLPHTGAQNRIAAGTVPHTSGPSVGDRASGLVGRAGATAGELRDSASGAASQASSKAGAALHGAGDAASGAMRSAGDAAGGAMRSAGDAAGAARDRLAASAHDARDYAYGASDSARQGLGWLMREQPLVLGAIGVALGAAVGALLPGTETEDRMMGETRDAVAERAQAAAQEGYERVKETAGEHVEHAKAAAGDVSGKAGGAASGIGSAVTEAAQQMRHAARDAAHDLAGEARNTIGEGDAKGRGTDDRSDQSRTDQAKRGDTPIVGPAPTRSGPA